MGGPWPCSSRLLEDGLWLHGCPAAMTGRAPQLSAAGATQCLGLAALSSGWLANLSRPLLRACAGREEQAARLGLPGAGAALPERGESLCGWSVRWITQAWPPDGLPAAGAQLPQAGLPHAAAAAGRRRAALPGRTGRWPNLRGPAFLPPGLGRHPPERAPLQALPQRPAQVLCRRGAGAHARAGAGCGHMRVRLPLLTRPGRVPEPPAPSSSNRAAPAHRCPRSAWRITWTRTASAPAASGTWRQSLPSASRTSGARHRPGRVPTVQAPGSGQQAGRPHIARAALRAALGCQRALLHRVLHRGRGSGGLRTRHQQVLTRQAGSGL
jgi:hypothetical protein